MAVLDEAVAGGVLAGSGPRLRFRHALIRQALTDSMPPAMRAALHAEAARTLHAAGAPGERVAEQLLGSAEGGGLAVGWALDWLVEMGGWLVHRAPRAGVELLQAAQAPPADPRRELLAG